MITIFFKIWTYLNKKRKLQFLVISFLIVLSSFTEVISIGSIVPFLAVVTNPEIIKNYLNNYNITNDFFLKFNQSDWVLFLTSFFAFSALLAGGVRLLLLYVTIHVSNATGADLSVELYRKTLFQSYKVHIQRNTSEIISGITHKVSSTTGVLVSLISIFSSIIVFISILFTLFLIDIQITIISSLIFASFYIFLGAITKSKILKNGEIIAHEQTKVIKSLQEGLGGIRDVILDNNQNLYCEIYKNSVSSMNKSFSENSFMNQAPRYVMEAVGLILISILAFTATREKGDITSTIPALGALGMGAQRLLPILQMLYGNWTVYTSLQASLKDVFSFLDQEVPQEYLINSDKEPLSIKHSIEIKELNYSYPNTNTFILNSVNLIIPVGSRVGIVGQTGSGKSTFMDLIMGLIEPTSGTISIDGIPLTSDNFLQWRKSLAHVPQSIFLTDATIAENIALGISKTQIDKKKLQNAIEKAQLSNFVDKLPVGVNTRVGERGVRLSGGQRQRIGIARAIYKDAKVIFFDEATSALDEDTELVVMKEIYQLSKDLTIFIIAHRKNTISNCDFFVEVVDSKIIKIIR